MKNTATCTTFKQHRRLFSLVLSIGIAFSANATGIKKINCMLTDSSSKDVTRFTVSFSSICCGINHKKRDALLLFANKYKPGGIIYTAHSWGHEGEVDYCFRLNELSEKEQQQFIKKSRKLLGKDRTIGTFEHIVCPR